MNRRQLWKVVSVVLLVCGFASAQKITSFSAPGAGTGAGQGTGGFGINPQGTVVGSYLDDGNVFHGSSPHSMLRARAQRRTRALSRSASTCSERRLVTTWTPITWLTAS
jgi:hypothetical protein